MAVLIESPLRALAAVSGCWVLWRLYKKFVLYKDPFAHIPGPASDSWIMGNLEKVFDKYGWDVQFGLTKTYGRVFSMHGFVGERMLFTYDPKALHHIVVKDQHIYEETPDFIVTNLITFGAGLLSTLGDHHRKQRKLLNPVFSIAHMREMTPVFYNVVRKLQNSIEKTLGPEKADKEIDLLEWMTRTALELIGQSGFGYSFDSLEVDAPPHPFGASVKNLFRGVDVGLLQPIRILFLNDLVRIGSPKFRRWVVDTIPWPALHAVRDMVDVMQSTSEEIFEATKKSLREGKDLDQRIGGGKDIMSQLVKANMEAPDDEKIPESELLAQISTLTFAGMDTTSNALARIFEMLCKNPEAQDKLRQELMSATEEHGDSLDYDTLTALPYLDAICRETMRLWPPVPVLARYALADAVLPFSEPITTVNGDKVSEVFVPKDATVIISLMACNRDPKIWGPDADEWKPERWLSPLPQTVAEARVPGVYSNLMTFLGGGRACIGFKFSQLEMKVVLHLLVQKFTFTPSEKEVKWQMNGIVQPTTDDAEIDPQTGEHKLQFPIRIGLAKAA